MIRQYGGHRRRGGINPLGVGVIATGSIFYLQNRGFLDDRFGVRRYVEIRGSSKAS
jgi:hypothetical protein